MEKNTKTLKAIKFVCNNKSMSKFAINQLELLALRGIRFTLAEAILMLLNPSNGLDEQLLARLITKQWILSLKKRYKRRGIWFGAINKRHQYGFCETVQDQEFIRKRELRRQKGLLKSHLFLENCLREFERKEKLN